MQDEKTIEKYLRDRVIKKGGLCFKFTSPGVKGVPDRIVIYKGFVYFIELKAKNGKVSKMQKHIIEKIREQGIVALILFSKNEIDLFIKEYL